MLTCILHVASTDKEAAFEFLSKFEKMVEEDKKASVRLLSGEIELHLQDKNPSTSKCKDLAPIRVGLVNILLNDQQIHCVFRS